MDTARSSSRSADPWEHALGELSRACARVRAGELAIVAGHYCVADALTELSASGEAEEATFLAGVQLRARLLALGRAASVVLWVNDIGVPPHARSALKGSYRLPPNYEAIWSDRFSGRDGLHVWFESTMRNSASTLLRRLAKKHPALFSLTNSRDPGLVRCVGDGPCEISREDTSVYVVPGPAGERLVVKDGPNPKCNLILATLFRAIEERLRATAAVTIFNEIYRHRIRLGVHVARTVTGVSIPLIPAFSDGAELWVEQWPSLEGAP